ncbi:MAG: VanZ family protein [Chitinophagaceae bacterium]|nr:VanZ family protein [Chitinophagaceae bacterium]
MKKFIQSYLITKWPAITWSAIVFVLLAMPGKGLLSEGFLSVWHLDKLIHATLFFVLVWLWAHYLKTHKTITWKTLFMIALLATVYGIAMEFVQIYTGRDFSVGDMVADGAGAFLAAIIKNKPRWKPGPQPKLTAYEKKVF